MTDIRTAVILLKNGGETMLNGKKKLLIAAIIMILAALPALAACSQDRPAEQNSDAAEQNEEITEQGWEYFDTINPLRKTYSEISGRYESLEESGVFDGGVVLRADKKEFYLGFPRYSMDEIEDSDTCTSVYGTLETVFGITKSYASDDLENILSVTWKEDNDNAFYAEAERPDGKYIIVLNVETINELYSPFTTVSVFTQNEEN